MKKIIFALVVLMLTAPVWGAEVLITCQQIEANEPNVIVSYDNSMGQPVRGIGLNIVVDAGNILEVECLSKDFGYYIYPGSVDIEGGQEPTGGKWGTCVCDPCQYDDTLLGPNDSNGVTIEMASLYSPNDPDHNEAPNDVGDLVRIKVEGNCCITIVQNVIRAGVVMNDTTSLLDTPDDFNAPGCCVTGLDCFPSDDPRYDQWVLQGKPKAWCCEHQRDGDATGDGKISIYDVIAVKASWGKIYPDAAYDCRADFTHDGKISIYDIIKLKSNWGTTGNACQDDWKNDCGPHPCP